MLVYPNVKINLGLSVLRRRPDGYHDIETLFIPYFGMSDVLEIVPSDKLRFVASENVTWQDDLTLRAYSLLKSDFDLPPAYTVSCQPRKRQRRKTSRSPATKSATHCPACSFPPVAASRSGVPVFSTVKPSISKSGMST